MAKIDLPYVQTFIDRHGHRRYYFRRAGMVRLALPGEPGSRPFMDAYTRALAACPKPVAEERAKPGSISALLVSYYAGSKFRGLDPVTQRNYRHTLERFRTRFGDNLASTFDHDDIGDILTPMSLGAARQLRKRLRQMFAHAIAQGWRTDNPVTGVDPPKSPHKGFRAWEDEDIALFERAYPAGSRERLALYLLLYTGQRRSDVVTMGRQHVKADSMHISQYKGRKRDSGPVRLTIPIHPALEAELANTPKDRMTFLVTGQGLAFTHAGFTNWFSEAARRAGLPPRSSPHGLRKAAARRLAEAGCTTLEIASITGHTTIREVERYTASVDQARLAGNAMKRLAGPEREQDCQPVRETAVNPLAKSVT